MLNEGGNRYTYLEVARTPTVATAAPDTSWHDLYRAGGVSGLVVGVIYIVAAILIFTTPMAPASGGAQTLTYIAAHRSLYILKQVLCLSPSVFAMIVFLALYPALKQVNKSVAYLGVATGAIGIVSEALLPILGGAYAIYGVLVMVWFLVIGWQLYCLVPSSGTTGTFTQR